MPGSYLLHHDDDQIIHSVENSVIYITLQGHVTPRLDYRHYFMPKFEAINAQSVRMDDIKAFENFRLPVPPSVNANDFPAALVWCEKFSMFTSLAQLKRSFN